MGTSEHSVGKFPTPDDFGVDLEEAKRKEAKHHARVQFLAVRDDRHFVALWILMTGFWIFEWGKFDIIGEIITTAIFSICVGWFFTFVSCNIIYAILQVILVMPVVAVLNRIHSRDPVIIALERYESAMQEYNQQMYEVVSQRLEEKLRKERERDKEEKRKESQRLAEELRKKREQREYWLSLSGHEFERIMAELFRKSGMEVERTPGSDDAGVDIFVNDGTGKIAVQCKAHKKSLSPAVAREFYGALRDKNCAKGILIGLGGFTKRTREFAARNQIELWDIDDVIRFAKDKAPTPSGRNQGQTELF